jgi:hypothetical protein
MGEIELSDWMLQEGVQEAYRLVEIEVPYDAPAKIWGRRLCSKSIIDVRGDSKVASEETKQSELDSQKWSTFCQIVEETGFWRNSDEGWKATRLVEDDSGQVIFEGWKNGAYKLRRGQGFVPYDFKNNSIGFHRNFGPISEFVWNILRKK